MGGERWELFAVTHYRPTSVREATSGNSSMLKHTFALAKWPRDLLTSVCRSDFRVKNFPAICGLRSFLFCQ